MEPQRCVRSLNGVLPPDVGRAARRRRRRTASTPAATRARAPTATGCWRAAAPSPFERERALWWPRPLDRAALDACAAALAGNARLHRLHPDADRARALRARRAARRMAAATATCSSSGSRPTRSCGTWCGCWSERCSRWQRAGGRWTTSQRLLEGAPRSAGGTDGGAARPLPGVGALLSVTAARCQRTALPPTNIVSLDEGPAHERRRHPGHRPERDAARAAGGPRHRAGRDRARREPLRERAQHHDAHAAVGRGDPASRTARAASRPTARRSTACASRRSA